MMALFTLMVLGRGLMYFFLCCSRELPNDRYVASKASEGGGR